MFLSGRKQIHNWLHSNIGIGKAGLDFRKIIENLTRQMCNKDSGDLNNGQIEFQNSNRSGIQMSSS
jgi:hypothetical protein